ncbi:MAG: LacI family DNA-binding transcriptional regulator [Nocardioidaceae bacterium]
MSDSRSEGLRSGLSVTIDAVAHAAGVSRQTVSNALNAPERLRPETLTSVLDTISCLGYRPNRAARSLRTRASKLVGLRVNPAPTGSAGSLLDRFLHALVEQSVGAGYNLLAFTPMDPRDELSGFQELLSTTAVDAFVLTDTHRGDRRLEWLADQEARFVAFGRPWDESLGHPWVDVDGAQGSALAVQHLIEQGHHRIGFLGWPADSDVGEDRRVGWQRACERAGLPTGGLVAHSLDDIKAAGRAAAGLLDAAQPPTALVCASDTLALGVFALLYERGLRPGRDVAVSGFDDTPAAAVVPVGLTSVRQPLEDVATAIVDRLMSLLSAESARGRRPTSRGALLAPTLVVRGSTEGRIPWEDR